MNIYYHPDSSQHYAGLPLYSTMLLTRCQGRSVTGTSRWWFTDAATSKAAGRVEILEESPIARVTAMDWHRDADEELKTLFRSKHLLLIFSISVSTLLAFLNKAIAPVYELRLRRQFHHDYRSFDIICAAWRMHRLPESEYEVYGAKRFDTPDLPLSLNRRMSFEWCYYTSKCLLNFVGLEHQFPIKIPWRITVNIGLCKSMNIG